MIRALFIHTSADFSRLVVLGTTPETQVIEFKKQLDGFGADKPDVLARARMECARDIAQFANTLGGVLLIGVEEEERPDGGRIASRIESVTAVDRKREWIDESVRRYLVPNTLPITIVTLKVGGDSVLAVNIGASRAPVAVYDPERKTIEYVRRINGGKQNMDPETALRFTLDRSRAVRITLSEIVGPNADMMLVELASAVKCARKDNRNSVLLEARYASSVRVRTLGDREVALDVQAPGVGQGTVHVPYGLIQEAWRTSSNSLGLVLDVAIVFYYDETIKEWKPKLER